MGVSDFQFSKEKFVELDFWKPMIAVALLALVYPYENVVAYAAIFMIFLYLFVWSRQLHQAFLKRDATAVIKKELPVEASSGVVEEEGSWLDTF